jgi:hypothetical protein
VSEQLHPHADAVVTVATALSAMMLSVSSYWVAVPKALRARRPNARPCLP